MTSEHINPDRFADSAGVPWQGRHFEANQHSQDDGKADEVLVQALAEFQNQVGSIEAVFAALRNARVLVPLVASLGESAEGAHGQTVDKSADLAIVSVQTPDGQVGIPVFSCVETMSAWNKTARPVPSDVPRVALAAASEQATRVVLDPGSPTEFVMRRPMIEAMAQSLGWSAPWADDSVKAAFAAVLKEDTDVSNWAIYTEDLNSRLVAPEVTVLLKLREGLDQRGIDALVEQFMESCKLSAVIAARVDSMQLKLTR